MEPDASGESAAVQSRDGRGTNQTGVRLYNERLILSLIRRHGSLTKVDIARLTGLSTQTTTVTINRLKSDGLLRAGERQRGRIGQPAVPYSLNPDGAFALGLKIGRRSSDLVLMDFVAGIRARRRITYAHPEPAELMTFAGSGIPELTDELSARQRDRIAGLGVAMPFELWNWEAELEMPAGTLGDWRSFDVTSELSRVVAPWPVRVCNDATSACAAELTFGRGATYRDFAYFYVGAFAGGGVVLNGSLFPGRSGNAGALGSMPVLRTEASGAAGVQQLIRSASLYLLERRLVAAGQPGTAIWLSPGRLVELRRPPRLVDRRGGGRAGPGRGRGALGDRLRGRRHRRRLPRRRPPPPCRAHHRSLRRHEPPGPHRRRHRRGLRRPRRPRHRRRRHAPSGRLRPRLRRPLQGELTRRATACRVRPCGRGMLALP